jgi:site-specific recombinase XerD
MEEGVSLYTIKDLLGHSSITMTEIYLASHGTVFKDSVSKIAFR